MDRKHKRNGAHLAQISFWTTLVMLFLGLAACSNTGRSVETTPLEPTPIYSPSTKTKSNAPGSTGIKRAALERVLMEGPGRFLQRVRLMPFRQDGRFIGFQVMTLFPGENLRVDAPQVGDVIVSVNGSRIDRPEQLQAVWETLRSADVIEILFWRAGQMLAVKYPIVY